VGARRNRRTLAISAVAIGLLVLATEPQSVAAPFTDCDQAYAAGVACELADDDSTVPAEVGNVGTAVQVVIHKSFEELANPDQCVGAWTLATIRRGSSVVLSEGSLSGDTRKLAIGQFFRSRLKDGVCQVLYITSAPMMPIFNAQFVGPDGQLSSTFGPVTSQPVTDQPGIQQAVRIDMEFEPQT
jgi:hypothetical protein